MKGYIEIPKLKMDFGPIFSTFDNDVEGQRLGGENLFGSNILGEYYIYTIRIQGHTGISKDNKFKYGISGKWMVDKKNRIILSAGNQ